MTFADHLLYALAWAVFALLHSLTAGATLRTGLGRLFGRGHRLAYNALAVIELALVVGVGVLVGADARAFVRPLWLDLVQLAMVLGGFGLGVAAMRGYRAGPFLGWAQMRGEDDNDQPLVLAGLHARIRHPLYSAALLIVWGVVQDERGLATAIWVSLYFYLGSRIEERRLVARYGAPYRAYLARVPRFIPRVLGRKAKG